jgi:hypothetical protein
MNFAEYLKHQSSEDRRAFILHFPAVSGKTYFARKARETIPDVELLDLQQYFLNTSGLPGIKDCTPKVLKNILFDFKTDQSVVIVDHLDFLFNTWKKQQKLDFLEMIKQQWRSPADTEKTYVFLMQSDENLEGVEMLNTYGESRVLALNKFDSL